MKRVTNKLLQIEIARGDVLFQNRDFKGAIECFSGVLEKIDKTYVFDRCEICRKIGDCYLGLNDKDNAIIYLEKSLFAGNPNESVFAFLAYLYFDIDIQKSLEYHQKAFRMAPLRETTLSGKCNAILKSEKYDQKKLKETYEKDVEIFRSLYMKNQKQFVHAKDNPDKKLHIGYISADYRRHAMMTFVRPILQSHNTDKFNFTLYSITKTPDSATVSIQNTKGMTYKDCKMLSSRQLAALIYEDKVDVLVDLSGYTASKVFAFLYKPAPVIIGYLGFNNTMGMREVDYILTDKYSIPVEMQKYYTEKPLYLKTTMQRWLPSTDKWKEVYDETPPYRKNGYFTFGSFNTVAKINDLTVEMWSKVLKNAPNSKLYFFRTQMTNAKIELLVKKFNQYKIEKERLIFQNPSTVPNHFLYYAKCDAALDPVPFSGLTISLEQSIMGIPVITMPLASMHSKSTARVNKVLGLDELIAKDENEYIKIARDLVQNPQRIDEYRKTIPQKLKNSPIMNDYKSFTAELENLYTSAYKKFCEE